MRRDARLVHAALVCASAAVAATLLLRAHQGVARAESAPPSATGAPPSATGAPPSAGAAVDLQTRPDAMVKIVLTVLPSTKKATVSWGKKRLGVIAPHQPLVVQRPRDSGPLDLVVHSDGCVTVQTRAYTFGDNKIAVKLTPLEEKNTLLGYREELPPDGGAPAALDPDGGAR